MPRTASPRWYALAHLGVEHIPAYSPQASGRSERLFQPPQDRLVKELALAGIADIQDANAFLRQAYVPAHNARFAAPASEPGSAFVAIPGVDLAEILCVHEERTVGNDNCVSFNRLKLQIPESPMRAHFVRAKVKVRQYPDGSLAVFHSPACIGRYTSQGNLLAANQTPPLKSALRRSCGNVDKPRSLPTVPQGNITRRSGQLMCYENRTS